MVDFVPFGTKGALPRYVNSEQLRSQTGQDHIYDPVTRMSYPVPWRWVKNDPFIFRGTVRRIYASRSAAVAEVADSVTGISYPMTGKSFLKLLNTQGYFGTLVFRADFEKKGIKYFLRYLGPPETSESGKSNATEPLPPVAP